MSEESKFNSNIAMVGVAVAIAAVAWFAVSTGNPSDTQVATIADPPSEVVPAVAGIEKDEVVEEVTVYADPTNLPSDEELKTDELVEKAQEAADRNQANEDDKSEDVE